MSAWESPPGIVQRVVTSRRVIAKVDSSYRKSGRETLSLIYASESEGMKSERVDSTRFFN